MHELAIIQDFRTARHDATKVVLEGFHALKHAARFSAAVEEVIVVDLQKTLQLAEQLAPDVASIVRDRAVVVSNSTFKECFPQLPHHSKVAAIARRPNYRIGDLARMTPLVALENPRAPGNLGASIRVAAAAGAAGLITIGGADLWEPASLRGSAGLHFALPVLSLERFSKQDFNRQLYACDPDGRSIEDVTVPANAILLFGTERQGISTGMLEAADERISIPMEKDVSSLNLATSVAVMLYVLRLKSSLYKQERLVHD